MKLGTMLAEGSVGGGSAQPRLGLNILSTPCMGLEIKP